MIFLKRPFVFLSGILLYIFPKLGVFLLTRKKSAAYVKRFLRANAHVFTRHLRARKVKKYNKTLILIRTDAIGDYVLFHNFIEVIRNSDRFKDYKIVFFGNIIWKDLAVMNNSEFVDEFVWYNRSELFTEFREIELIKYAYKLSKYSAEILVNAVISRENVFEQMIGLTIAKIKLAPENDYINNTQPEMSKFYNQLIKVPNYCTFEFFRNQTFINELTSHKQEITKPYLNFIHKKSISLPAEYALLFPGAGVAYRRWSALNYARVAAFIKDNYDLDVVFAGGSGEIEISKIIHEHLKTDFIDLIGKTSLLELVEVIQGAKILVSNETSAVHIGVATNRRIICLSNGNHFGRFNPYPSIIWEDVHYIYPKFLRDEIALFPNRVCEKFKYFSDLDINKIPVEDVTYKIKELLDLPLLNI
ncbi:MAG: hypothetical protein OHK0053_23540 [Microscillaceae bacterium]